MSTLVPVASASPNHLQKPCHCTCPLWFSAPAGSDFGGGMSRAALCVAREPKIKPSVANPCFFPVDKRQATASQPQHIAGMHIAMHRRFRHWRCQPQRQAQRQPRT